MRAITHWPWPSPSRSHHRAEPASATRSTTPRPQTRLRIVDCNRSSAAWSRRYRTGWGCKNQAALYSAVAGNRFLPRHRRMGAEQGCEKIHLHPSSENEFTGRGNARGATGQRRQWLGHERRECQSAVHGSGYCFLSKRIKHAEPERTKTLHKLCCLHQIRSGGG